MNILTKRVAQLEAELGREWKAYHVTAQLARFGTGFLATLLWSMHNGFTDWTDLLPLAGTAAWTTAMQLWPRAPWWLVTGRSGSAPMQPAPPAKG